MKKDMDGRPCYSPMGEKGELTVKFLLCAILGLLFSRWIGDPYSPTAAVTANLVVYIDRGTRGSAVYGIRRILAQMVQGGLVVGVICLAQSVWKFPVDDTGLAILASCIALLIGLPLHLKYHIAPLHTTLANATFIIACGVLKNPSFFRLRLSHCLAGVILAFGINQFVALWHDRYRESLWQAQVCGAHIMREIFQLCDLSDEAPDRPEEEFRMIRERLAINVKRLMEDCGKAPWRKRCTPAQLRQIKGLLSAVEALEQIRQDVGEYWPGRSGEYRGTYMEELVYLYQLQQDICAEGVKLEYTKRVEEADSARFIGEGEAGILLYADLLRLQNILVDALPAEASGTVRDNVPV